MLLLICHLRNAVILVVIVLALVSDLIILLYLSGSRRVDDVLRYNFVRVFFLLNFLLQLLEQKVRLRLR